MSPTAVKTKSTFRQSVRVDVDITATPEKIWSLLTNVAETPRWNSTITQIDGRVALGEQLKIKVPISTRTFSVKVDIVEPYTRLVWSDGNAVFRGVRTYTLTPKGGGRRPSRWKRCSPASCCRSSACRCRTSSRCSSNTPRT